MTKRERAEVDARIEELETYRALRWTGPVDPDVPPPALTFTYSRGWDVHAMALGSGASWGIVNAVERAWSDTIAHGRGDPPADGVPRKFSASRGARTLYSTRLRALRALRHAVEREAAGVLRRIDRAIDEEAKREGAE